MRLARSPSSQPFDQLDAVAEALEAVLGPEEARIGREIAALVADQARDDANPRASVGPGSSVPTIDATSLGIDPTEIPESPPSDGPRRFLSRWRRYNATSIVPAETGRWVLLCGLNPWIAAEYPDQITPGMTCPVCGSVPLRESSICTRCNATGADGATRFPGIGVGMALRRDCPPEYLIRPRYVAPIRGGRSYRGREAAG